jgi:hypothetical protein
MCELLNKKKATIKKLQNKIDGVEEPEENNIFNNSKYSINNQSSIIKKGDEDNYNYSHSLSLSDL